MSSYLVYRGRCELFRFEMTTQWHCHKFIMHAFVLTYTTGTYQITLHPYPHYTHTEFNVLPEHQGSIKLILFTIGIQPTHPYGPKLEQPRTSSKDKTTFIVRQVYLLPSQLKHEIHSTAKPVHQNIWLLL